MEKSQDLNKKIATGMIWRFMERGGIQIVQFVIQIVLARILSADDYGILAILMVFIAFSNTLINNGLGNAIIQRKDVTEEDYNTVFYVQLLIAIICMGILFVAAPWIENYYSINNLAIYLRSMVIILLIEALSSVQLNVLRKTLQFRKSFIANVFGVVIQGVTGIALAVSGFGVWSLIISQIAMKLAIYICMLILIHWRPRKVFSFKRLKVLFSYSWKLTVAWMIGTLHQQVYSLVVGKFFSTETLGYYNRGQNLPQTLTTTVNETISAVMFPALSLLQDDRDQLKAYTRKMMALTAFVVAPIMAGVAAISRNFVMVVLTEKWAPSIPMMQLFCISMGINIVSTTNMQAFNSLGRSDVFMKLEIVKRTISLALLFVAAHYSIYHVIVVLALMGVFSLVYNTFPNRKLLNYTIKEQLIDMLPSVLISLAMFGVVILVNKLNFGYGLSLVLQIIVGVVFYFGISYLFNKELVQDGLNLVKKIVKR